MNILLIGSGGRECAIAKGIKSGNLYCYSNFENPQIKRLCKGYFVYVGFSEEDCLDICSQNNIESVIIGSESFLVTDIVEKLHKKGIFVLAPDKYMAKIETSKIFARETIKNANLNFFNPDLIVVKETTTFLKINEFLEKYDNNVVVKPDRPCGGKGVKVYGDHLFSKQDIIDYVYDILKGGQNLIIEEKLVGQEFSLHTLCDGVNFYDMNPVQDFKRKENGNRGPNTGSMGCIANGKTLNFLKDTVSLQTAQNINSIILKHLNDNATRPYIGFLYGSFIMTKDLQVKIIEFNARLGDPEAIPLVQNIDFSKLCYQVKHRLVDKSLFDKDISSITSYIVPKEYAVLNVAPFKINLDNLTEDEMEHVLLANVNQDYVALGSRTLALYFESYDLKKMTEKMYRLQNKILENNPDLLHARTDFLECYEKNDLYTLSGVNVEEGNKVVREISDIVKTTYNENVLNEIGSFGGCYDIKSVVETYDNPVLVSSIDGVGTKSILCLEKLGVKRGLFQLGQDIVNHCVNDILVQGAKPLYFLDYIATSNIKSENVVEFVKGVSKACKEANCVLIGGETAEMPNIYRDSKYDFVGCMVGVVEKSKVISGKSIQKNDVILGLPSSGPHTNGYSLLRKIIEENQDSFSRELIEECCTPHKSYLNDINNILEQNIPINGLCHVTGGGFDDNIQRIIPKSLKVEWYNFQYSPLFKHIEKIGSVKNMKDIFNCGVGMLIVVDNKYTKTFLDLFENIKYIGRVI